MPETDDDDPPIGFQLMGNRAGSEQFAGPFYIRQVGDGIWQMGFRVTARKLNPAGACHGGIMALFADILCSAIKRQLKLKAETPTVNLNVDYVAPARDGDWVDAQPQLVRQTRTLLFTQSIINANGATCARASGIYRIKAQRGTAADD